jgi:uncharacterized protein YjbI with pentapeptide repeats
LSGTNLRFANLNGINLTDADLISANLTGVKGLKKVMVVKANDIY